MRWGVWSIDLQLRFRTACSPALLRSEARQERAQLSCERGGCRRVIDDDGAGRQAFNDAGRAGDHFPNVIIVANADED